MNNSTFILLHLIPKTMSNAWSVKYTAPINQHCVWNSCRKYLWYIWYGVHYIYDVYWIHAGVWIKYNMRIYRRNMYCTICWTKDITTQYISDVFIYHIGQNIFKYWLTFECRSLNFSRINKTTISLIEHLCFVISDKVHKIRRHAACNKTNNKSYAYNSTNRFITIYHTVVTVKRCNVRIFIKQRSKQNAQRIKKQLGPDEKWNATSKMVGTLLKS